MFALTRLISMPSFKNLFKTSSIYAFGNFMQRAMPALLLPIMTRYLTPTDYGILATFMTILGVVEIVIYMGTTDAVLRSYYDINKENFKYPEYVFNAIIVCFFVFIIMLLVWVSLKNYLVNVIPVPFIYQILILILGFFIAVTFIPSKLFVIMKEPVQYIIFNSANTFIELSSSIILIIVVGLDWRGRVFGIAIAKSIFFVIGLYILFKKKFLKFTLNKMYQLNIFHYGFPVVLHSAGFVIIGAINNLFLNKFTDLSITGLYNVSYTLCSLITFVSGSFIGAWLPVFYEKLGNPSQKLKIKLVKLTYLYFILIVLGVSLFVLFIPMVLGIVVGDKFIGSKIFIFWLALGTGFHCMYTMVVSYIFYSKKTFILSKIAVLTVIISIILNYIFIKKNGAVGIAQATCLVFFIRFILVWYFSNKMYPMPWIAFFKKSLNAIAFI